MPKNILYFHSTPEELDQDDIRLYAKQLVGQLAMIKEAYPQLRLEDNSQFIDIQNAVVATHDNPHVLGKAKFALFYRDIVRFFLDLEATVLFSPKAKGGRGVRVIGHFLPLTFHEFIQNGRGHVEEIKENEAREAAAEAITLGEVLASIEAVIRRERLSVAECIAAILEIDVREVLDENENDYQVSDFLTYDDSTLESLMGLYPGMSHICRMILSARRKLRELAIQDGVDTEERFRRAESILQVQSGDDLIPYLRDRSAL